MVDGIVHSPLGKLFVRDVLEMHFPPYISRGVSLTTLKMNHFIIIWEDFWPRYGLVFNGHLA